MNKMSVAVLTNGMSLIIEKLDERLGVPCMTQIHSSLPQASTGNSTCVLTLAERRPAQSPAQWSVLKNALVEGAATLHVAGYAW